MSARWWRSVFWSVFPTSGSATSAFTPVVSRTPSFSPAVTSPISAVTVRPLAAIRFVCVVVVLVVVVSVPPTTSVKVTVVTVTSVTSVRVLVSFVPRRVSTAVRTFPSLSVVVVVTS